MGCDGPREETTKSQRKIINNKHVHYNIIQ